MKSKQTLFESAKGVAEIVTCEVNRVCDNDVVVLVREGEIVERTFCDVLQTSEGPGLCLAVGDTVVVWLPENDEERGIILGRIGPSNADAEKQKETPDEIVIEAKN
jgi:hypothetical protein